jgi:hypothetical protein
MDPEIQGTQFHIQKLPTGETMLGVEYGMTTVGALRILTPENHLDARRQGWQLSSSTFSPGHLTGRSDSDGGQLINLSRLRRWLHNCDSNHGQLCNSFRSDTRCASDIPLILIDVRDRCLVPATSAERYFTLSYVWCKVDMPRTLKSNYQQRLQKRSLMYDRKNCKRTSTIEDAMVVVHAMGER